jgi:hypothetical protein
MEWMGILVGAVIGIALDRVVGQLLDDRSRAWFSRRRYRLENAEWAKSELTSGSLQVTQTGWGADGCFPPASVIVRLVGNFEPTSLAEQLRHSHNDEWTAAGFKNGRQVGTKALLVGRESDEPEAAQDGTSHTIRIDAHEYDYFDFLATHRLRLTGTEAERSVLDQLVGDTSTPRLAPGFPTPLSVGLSVLPDGGNTLALGDC